MYDMISVAEERRADFAREAEQQRRTNQLVVRHRGPGRSRQTIGRVLIRAGTALADPINADRA